MLDKLLVEIEGLVLDNLVFTRDELGYKVGQGSDEWKLDNSICDIKGSVGEGNGHFWSQIECRFKPLNQASERYKEDNTDNRTNHVKGDMSTSNTFGSDIGSKRSNNSCNGRSDIITKQDW